MSDRPRSYYWVIESPHRGCFVEFDWTGAGKWAPRFKYSVLRSDRAVKRYYSEDAAKRALAKVLEASASSKAYIHRMG